MAAQAARAEGATPLFSVILVNHNGPGLTVAALDSLLEQGSVAWEALVVDSASSDGTPDEIRGWIAAHPEARARLLAFDTNVGFAVGCNRGVQATTGPLVLFLNNDAELMPGALAQAARAMEANPDAGCAMLSMRVKSSPETLNSTGLILFWDASAMDRDWMVPLSRNARDVNEVVGPNGGAALYRREVLDRVGLFDEEFFMYSEDVDLALRARRAGYRCIYIPDAGVLHRGGASVAKVPRPQVKAWAHRNTFLTLMRNFPAGARLLGTLVFVGRGLPEAIKDGPVFAGMRLRALGYWWRHRRRIAQERASIRALGPDERVMGWVQFSSRSAPRVPPAPAKP